MKHVSWCSKPHAILTSEQAIAIFLLKKYSVESGRNRPCASRIARGYGISEKAVRDIWKGRTWCKETSRFEPTRPPHDVRPVGRPKGRKDSAPRSSRQPKPNLPPADTNSCFDLDTFSTAPNRSKRLRAQREISGCVYGGGGDDAKQGCGGTEASSVGFYVDPETDGGCGAQWRPTTLRMPQISTAPNQGLPAMPLLPRGIGAGAMSGASGVSTAPPTAGLECDIYSAPPAAAAEAGAGMSWSPTDAMLAAAAAGVGVHLSPTAAAALSLWRYAAVGGSGGVRCGPGASAWQPPEHLPALPAISNAAALGGSARFRFGEAQPARPPPLLLSGWHPSLSQLACAVARPPLHARLAAAALLLDRGAGGLDLGF